MPDGELVETAPWEHPGEEIALHTLELTVLAPPELLEHVACSRPQPAVVVVFQEQVTCLRSWISNSLVARRVQCTSVV